MKIVLDAPRCGLGDALLYSTLPEIYAERGDEVWITTQSEMRNPEAHQLIWGDNPYVRDRRCNEPSNAGSRWDRQFFTRARFAPNPIICMEQAHGLKPSGRRFPKIYYEPKFLPEWKDVIAADPRSHSQYFPLPMFDEFAAWYVENPDEIVVLENKFNARNGDGTLPRNRRHLCRDIYEWCDIIASCKQFLVTESGGMSVAAAIREDKNSVFVLATHTFHNCGFFVYPELHYHYTGRLGPDYHPNVEKP